MELYAALYKHRYGTWPISIEIVPLQGLSIELRFDAVHAKRLLETACAFLHAANKRIADVKNGKTALTVLASPQVDNCRWCLFRPACGAYWTARESCQQEKWPCDLRGILREMTTLRNGKLCMRISESDSTAPLITIRNLTNCLDLYPSLPQLKKGRHVMVYNLKYLYRSGDYTETQSTVIYQTKDQP